MALKLLAGRFGEHDLRTVILRGTDHNTIDNSPEYAAALDEFL